MRTGTCIECRENFPGPPRGPVSERCPACLAEYRRKRRNAAAVIRNRRAYKPRVGTYTCQFCGGRWTGRKKKFCSRRCLQTSGDRRRRTRRPREEACVRCGAGIPERRWRYCTETCRQNDKSDTHRARRGGAKAVRRGLRRQIAERDGFRCWICGRGVSEGHSDPRHKLTLDHLVPVSEGGDHVPQNLRVACLSCNSRRGAKGAAQLLLVG